MSLCNNAVFQYTMSVGYAALAVAAGATAAVTAYTSRKTPSRGSWFRLAIEANVFVFSVFSVISRACISTTVKAVFDILAALVRTQAVLLVELFWFDVSKSLKASMLLQQVVDRRDVHLALGIFIAFMVVDWITAIALLVVILESASYGAALAETIIGVCIVSFVLASTFALWLRVRGLVNNLKLHIGVIQSSTKLQRVVRFAQVSTVVYATFTVLLIMDVSFSIVFIFTNPTWLEVVLEVLALTISTCILLFAAIR